MSRRNLLNPGPRPVMGAAHGGTVQNTWEWMVSHKLLLEVVGLVVGLLVLAVLVYVYQTQPVGVITTTQPSAIETYRTLHNYDAIEDLRAQRLINPPLVADRSYDTIEDMRAQRLILQGDHSYDSIEDLRALRLINAIPTPDHSYDAIEDLRANRDLEP